MNELISDLFADLLQLKYPRELRISMPPRPDNSSGMLREIGKLIDSHPPGKDVSSSVEDAEQTRYIAEIGTGLWRIRRSLVPAGEKEPAEANRRTLRFVESTWDALSQGGVEVVDHDGDIISGGEAVRILAFQPMEGILREQVLETIRPTIYYRGKLVQRGEVIVGKPERGKQ